MKWVPHDVVRERSTAWMRIPVDLRGHHAQLLAYCAQQETGGTIDHKGWKDLDWQRTCGFRRKTLKRLFAFGLATPVAPTLLSVSYYDGFAEKRAQRSSDLGRKLAILRWERHAARIDELVAAGHAPRKATRNATGQPRPGQQSPSLPQGSTPPKAPPSRGGPPAPSALDRIRDAWPWPERFAYARVERALRELAGEVDVEAICAGMRLHGKDERWRRANPSITAAIYVRNRRWLETRRPRPPAAPASSPARVPETPLSDEERARRLAELKALRPPTSSQLEARPAAAALERRRSR